MSRPSPFAAGAAAPVWRSATAVAGVASAGGLRAGPGFSFGAAAVDARIGSLPQAALHELFAASAADAATTAGFALLLAQRVTRAGPIIWLREQRQRDNGRLYGLGCAELGCDPDRILLVEAPDTVAVLRAGADAVACGAVATVIIEPFGAASAFDLTASRRLALAAARSGVAVLALRSGDPRPSAAHSRWRIAAAPSAALSANAPGHGLGHGLGLPAFAITLLRHRGGLAGFSAQLEWDRDRAAFGTALSGAVPAAAFERKAAPGWRRPAAGALGTAA